jgi:hypothetical protein
MAGTVSFSPVSGLFSGEFIQFDPEIVKSVDEIASKGTIEDVLG